MDRTTQVKAEDGKQDLMITREFDLPLELLFKAFVEPEIVEQWMGSKVLKLEAKTHGSYQLEKKDDKGNVVFRANGAIHLLVPNQKIVRTFEMENAPLGVQFESYRFEQLTGETSRLCLHVIYESVAQRDQLLKMVFMQGVNMAHNRLQEVVNRLK